jgi:uncharacterized protein
VNQRQFQFEWDEAKASSNARKHGVSFERAATVFYDPRILTIPDVEHSNAEDRWFSLGMASDGVLLTLVYVWLESSSGTTKIRLICARRGTRSEARYYEESL